MEDGGCWCKWVGLGWGGCVCVGGCREGCVCVWMYVGVGVGVGKGVCGGGVWKGVCVCMCSCLCLCTYVFLIYTNSFFQILVAFYRRRCSSEETRPSQVGELLV